MVIQKPLAHRAESAEGAFGDEEAVAGGPSRRQFTMSLFIAELALDEKLLVSGKIGALLGSALSAAIGFTLLWWFLRKNSASRK